ncbi:MAG: NADH-quinone oxidoreductase subunit H, partial [Verrucomicrobiota bacterium JB022]|nr:NADH-quinone oxidoreductase subunit H [Verrucomicrobiota bacterium JB022]
MDFLLENPLLLALVKSLIMVGVVMGMAAYAVLAERKVCAWIQGRPGPNRTKLPILGDLPIIGPFLTRLGIWQPMADGLKFLVKEEPTPGHVKRFYYILAPIVSFIPAMTTMTVLPVGIWKTDEGTLPLVLANLDIGILFILAISSLGVYGIVLGAWAGNNKYSFFGGVRSSAQMISYELALGMSILPVFMWANGPTGGLGDLTLFNVVTSQTALWNVIWMPIPAFVYLTALFAETNRLPFDMPETETELVGGFHTEYGGFKFGLYFTGEYAHMVIGSAIFTLLLFGGWQFLPTFGVLPDWVANPW